MFASLAHIQQPHLWERGRKQRAPWLIILAAFAFIIAIVILKEAGASDTDTDYLSIAVLIAALAFASTLDRRMGLMVAVLAGLIAAIVPGGATFFHERFLDALFRPIVLAAMSMSFYRVILVLRDREDHLTHQLDSLQLLQEEVTALHAMTVRVPVDHGAIAQRIVRGAVQLGAGRRSRLLIRTPVDETWEILAQWPPQPPDDLAEGAASRIDALVADMGARRPFQVTYERDGTATITIPFTSGERTRGALQLERDGPSRDDDEYGRLLAIYARDAALTLEHIALQRQLEHLAVLGERGRIARDLHDGLVQSLAGIAFHLEYYRDELGPESATVREGFDAMATAVKEALHEARAMIHGLRTEPAPNNLSGMLRSIVEQIESKSDLAISADVPDGPLPLSLEQEDALVRVAQEALQNVIKHAAATHVRLSVGVEADGVILRVVDDGCGFTPSAVMEGTPDAHFGLRGMTERAEVHGGHLTIDSRPGDGTTVTLVLPVTRGAAAR
jgi:signal transduction histidine kinase